MKWTLALALLATTTTAEEPGLRDWFGAYSAPTIAGRGFAVSDRTVELGHLRLHFTGGALYPVIVSDRLAGAFFVGTGSFDYRSRDPFEDATYRRNTERLSDYEVDADGRLGDAFDSVLIMQSMGNDALGDDSWTSGTTPSRASARFQAHIERFAEGWAWSYRRLMPHAMVDPPDSPVRVAEIHGREHDVVYLRDPLRTGDESLAVLVPSAIDLPALEDRRYLAHLSVQPLDRSRLDARPAPWRIVALDAVVEHPGDLTARIEIRETITAARPLRILSFYLASSFVGTTGPTASPEALSYHVNRITTGDAVKVPFVHWRGDLMIELPRVLEPGQSVELHFELGGDILYRPGHNNYWHLPTQGWYPRPLWWSMARFTYHAVVKTPKPWIPFSVGDTVRRWEEGDLACAEFRQEHPLDVATVLAGKYFTYTDERPDLTVRVSSYGMRNDRGAQTIASLVHAFVAFYEPFLGDYPFREVDVLEINDLGHGQAPGGIIYFSREAFNPMRDARSQAYAKGVNQRLAHEVAHAWWGDVAALSEPEHQWLSEATAEYYAALAMASMKDEGEARRALRRWRRDAEDAAEDGSVYLANYSVSRNDLLYGKGALVLAALHRELGDEAFFTIMKSYLRSFAWQPASTREFLGLTSYVTKKDYRPWFDRYLFGVEMPEVEE